jgi:endonuclease III
VRSSATPGCRRGGATRPSSDRRIEELIALWPDATTTAAFLSRLAADDLGSTVRWRGQEKLRRIENLAVVLNAEGMQTPQDLVTAYEDEAVALSLMRTLRQIRGIGPKTVNYLAILAGSKQYVAVDRHLRAFVREAGITGLSDESVRRLYIAVAARRGWTPGDLDAAVWRYRTTVRKR